MIKLIRSILVQLSSIFFSILMVHPYFSIGTIAAWKKLRYILSDRSDFHMNNTLSIAVHAFGSHVLTSFSVGEMLLPK